MMVQDKHRGPEGLGDLLIALHVVRGKADIRKDDLMADQGRRIGPRPRIRRTDREVEGVRTGALGQKMGARQPIATVPVEDHSAKCQRHFER
jgi:hypothetical protein